MRVLLDYNVPHRLRQSLTGHDIYTAEEMGLARLENGELLRIAEDSSFAVMVTGDKNLSYQQNLTRTDSLSLCLKPLSGTLSS